MAKNAHEDWVEISGRKVKFNKNKAWIKDSRTSSEYSGTYLVPVSDMAENIGEYQNRKLKQQLAKYSARASKFEDSDNTDLKQKMESIVEEVTRVVIQSGQYVCSNCLQLYKEWNEMSSGMYTYINCSNCSR